MTTPPTLPNWDLQYGTGTRGEGTVGTDQPLVISANPKLFDALRYRKPEWLKGHERWDLLRKLVAGGEAMDEDAKRKILVNPDGRPEGVIKERLKNAPYINIIAPPIVGFNGQLFEKEPTYKGSSDKFWEDVFLKSGARTTYDDDNRASFVTFLREAMFEALTVGKAICQVDTAIGGNISSYAAQKSAGLDEPYVILLPRTALWDWDIGDKGFRFAKLHKWVVERKNWYDKPEGYHDFTIYAQQDDGSVLVWRYQVRKAIKSNEKPPVEENQFPLENLPIENVRIIPQPDGNGGTLEGQPIFNVNGKSLFPILTLTLPPTLQLADQLYDCGVAYFNTMASIAWKLLAVNYAMPVITGGQSVDEIEDIISKGQKFGDGWWLHLPTGWGISSLEMGGGGIPMASDFCRQVKQDVRDILYQVAVAAQDGAAVLSRSAASKKEDRRPEQILLETYGFLVREFATQVLNVAAIAHGEVVNWDVEGFKDFLGDGLSEDVSDATGSLQVGIQSPRFAKAIQKNFATSWCAAAGSAPSETAAILEEIDSLPDEKVLPPMPPPVTPGGKPATPPGASQPPDQQAQPVATPTNPRGAKK